MLITTELFVGCVGSDEEELRKSFSELGDSLCDSDASRSMKRVGSSGKPLSEAPEPSGSLLYKNGFLVRKVHADSDGKRSTSRYVQARNTQSASREAAVTERAGSEQIVPEIIRPERLCPAFSSEREERLENLLRHPKRADSLPAEGESLT